MRILFAGTSEIGADVLHFLAAEHELVGVLTQPDRPAGRKKEMRPPAIKKLLQECYPSIPVFQPEKLRDPDLLSTFQSLNPEVMVTISYGKILPLEILTLPTIACLNIHVSLLPRYRGASPIQAAILSGDEETGITVMYMAEGLDTGDILLQKNIKLDQKETSGMLSLRFAQQAPAALKEALQLLERGIAPRIPQEEKKATVTRCVLRADALLDWSQPAIVLERLIRAMNPKPGAHGILQLPSGESVVLKVFSASISTTPISLENKRIPGSFFCSEDHQLIVHCGEGSLLLHEVQPEGRSRMSSEAFARGLRLTA